MERFLLSPGHPICCVLCQVWSKTLLVRDSDPGDGNGGVAWLSAKLQESLAQLAGDGGTFVGWQKTAETQTVFAMSQE